jgi:hypothetical protein
MIGRQSGDHDASSRREGRGPDAGPVVVQFGGRRDRHVPRALELRRRESLRAAQIDPDWFEADYALWRKAGREGASMEYDAFLSRCQGQASVASDVEAELVDEIGHDTLERALERLTPGAAAPAAVYLDVHDGIEALWDRSRWNARNVMARAEYRTRSLHVLYIHELAESRLPGDPLRSAKLEARLLDQGRRVRDWLADEAHRLLLVGRQHLPRAVTGSQPSASGH